MQPTQISESDLVIIGAGMAGLSAAVFAANRKINTLCLGRAGAFEFSSGLIDLWGRHACRQKAFCKKPWQTIASLDNQWPNHPYTKIKHHNIEKAIDELVKSLASRGVAYFGTPKLNQMVLTPFGTIKPSFRIPMTMKNNVLAVKEKPPCLLVDFHGLREFSAAFIYSRQKPVWPGLQKKRIWFPGFENRAEIFTPLMAKAMETRRTRDRFVKTVKPFLKGKTHLGIPAIMGLANSGEIQADLEEKLSVSVFEIPTTPISVPGSRLKTGIADYLENSTVRFLSNHGVKKVENLPDNRFKLFVECGQQDFSIIANALILATGRFLGQGLKSDVNGVYENLLNLPIYQPDNRENWHSKHFFDLKGHRVNQAGIQVDNSFRPVDNRKKPVHPCLYAAGSILAHQDWMRTKSGGGLSIATSFSAVLSAEKELKHRKRRIP